MKENNIQLYKDKKHLLKLRARYFEIFEYRNGISDGSRHTQKETGVKFGISGTRIAQIEARVWYEVNRV
ncbi:hypothetical protein KGQ27_02590 [Patescibacteria group bacterium]|nr:hypothetical protein [Patescibacteria group bacterium]MDE1946455.1 hypothetical protein [Patescibacteria group bacterium]MDE2011062.1 hypothetical protein [Patescibacteria group bacterium]